ncbi:hypothetical protein Rhe02_09620 [Rhizocola hellebori]|uniref:Uncharacterized protein n=1 Tax=Rhizocola hellebori TaxID=1392758 RepID=A0A8J3Q2Z0_9ACTN|nr:hypothetical protein Rhe02_09620 [Rhizocola hellebori]
MEETLGILHAGTPPKVSMRLIPKRTRVFSVHNDNIGLREVLHDERKLNVRPTERNALKSYLCLRSIYFYRRRKVRHQRLPVPPDL